MVKAGVTLLQHKLLHCVGTVAKEANLPIFCHHDPSVQSGYDILNVYASAGVEPCRVILGHTGDCNDWAYQEDLVKAGAYIGFDRLAYGHLDNPVKNSVKNIVDLVGKGYINRIFLSHDWATYLAFWDSWETTSFRRLPEPGHRLHLHQPGGHPMLKAAGLTEADIHTIMVENPKNFFNGQ